MRRTAASSQYMCLCGVLELSYELDLISRDEYKNIREQAFNKTFRQKGCEIMDWWLCISLLLNALLLIVLISLKRNRDWFMKSYYELASFVLKARREGKL